MRVTPKCIHHQFAKREKRKEYYTQTLSTTHVSGILENIHIYYNIIINSSVMRACDVCAYIVLLAAIAAGHLSSRPENASSLQRSVLFFRSVAAISFSSDETKSRGLRVVITYYHIHMFGRARPKTTTTTTKRVYPSHPD